MTGNTIELELLEAMSVRVLASADEPEPETRTCADHCGNANRAGCTTDCAFSVAAAPMGADQARF